MDMLPWIVALSVALAVLGLGGLLSGYFLMAQRKISRQRQFDHLDPARQGGEAVFDVSREADDLTLPERFILFFSGYMPGAAPAAPVATDSEDRRLLIRAGYRSLRSLVFFQGLRWGLLAAAVVLFSTYALLVDTPTVWLRGVAACIVIFLVPRYVLRFFAQRRVQQLASELPVFIDFLRMMHSVGISFEQSISLFADDSRLGLPVLSSELAAVNMAIRSGRSRADALQLMARQLDVDEVSELVALICHTDFYGAAVQEPLRQFSQRLTEKKRFQMQEYVGKMATRMVIVMVLFLLPALIIVTAGPGFIAVFKALGNLT